jgi:alkylation response protein AidB-like acyl-CoA dehydrogenase
VKTTTISELRGEAVHQARALAERILPRAPRADTERRVPSENIDDLRAGALLRMAVPKFFGGTELGWGTVVESAAELARGCPSTAWLFGVFVGHIWLLSHLPLQAQREVFETPDPLISAVVRMAGNPPLREGLGYRFSGAEGRFCSGIHFADWVIVGAVADPKTEPDSRLFLLPKNDVEIVDDWFTVGMRGTGSCSIRIADAFVPEYRTVRASDVAAGNSPGVQTHFGSFYRAPFPDAVGFALIGIPLGIARAATECFAQSLRVKFQAMESEQLAEQGPAFVRFSDADADIDAATALIYADARQLDEVPDPRALPAVNAARIRRNLAYAAHRCRFAVTSLFEGGGGMATYDASTLQRLWRDMNAAAAHAMFSREVATPAFARLSLGLPPAKFARRTAHA